MATLFTIGAEFRALLDLMDEYPNGELPPEADATIAAWMDELSANEGAKLDGWYEFFRHLEMEASAATAEAEQYSCKARVRTAALLRSKEFLRGYLESTGRKKVETARGRFFRVQNNGGVQAIDWRDASVDPAALPERFVRVRREIDREAVRAALEAGEVLDFAALKPRGTQLRYG